MSGHECVRVLDGCGFVTSFVLLLLLLCLFAIAFNFLSPLASWRGCHCQLWSRNAQAQNFKGVQQAVMSQHSAGTWHFAGRVDMMEHHSTETGWVISAGGFKVALMQMHTCRNPSHQTHQD
jgi:hypothetical protein